MGRLHLVGGEKGGVGRSFTAKLLAQFCVDQVIPWAGFDSDRSHGSFRRSYADFVRAIEVERAADLDLCVEALEDGAQEVVVDLAGQSQASVERWLESGEVLELLDQLQHRLWFWYVMDPGRDSLLLLQSFLDGLGTRVRVVCVLNHGRGGDFSLFEEAKLRGRVERMGGVVLELPELHAESARKMDAHDKSFWAAIHHADPAEGPCLSLMQRQRAKVFLRRVRASLRELLLAEAG